MKKYSFSISILLSFAILFGANLAFAGNKMESASVENMAFPLPEKPSFAILPFNNTSGDAEPKYLCEGFTETLFDALSDNSSVFAISTMSTDKYKGKPFTAKKVAEELGVHYVISGDFQKSGDQLRISVQMIDALKDTTVWSETYDRKMNDILKIQDDIVLNVAKFAGAKDDRLIAEGRHVEGTNNVEAYIKNMRAFNLFLQRSPEGLRKAKELYQQAISLDSNYLKPYIFLSHTWSSEARWGFSDSPEKSMEMARNMAQAAIDLDKFSEPAHSAMGRALYNLREHDKAIAVFEQAIALNPDSYWAHFYFGFTLCYAGRPQESFPSFQKMRRSNPLNPQMALLGLGAANLFLGKYEEAIPYYQKMIDSGSKFYRAYLDLAAC